VRTASLPGPHQLTQSRPKVLSCLILFVYCVLDFREYLESSGFDSEVPILDGETKKETVIACYFHLAT